jgi:hypothetical protein
MFKLQNGLAYKKTSFVGAALGANPVTLGANLITLIVS